MRLLTLNDFVLPPPLPALVSMLIVAGVTGVSQSAIRRLKASPSACEQGAAFILTFAALGAAAHALVLAHAATTTTLRLLAAVPVVLGCGALLINRPRPAAAIRSLRDFWQAGSFFERTASVAIACTIFGLILAAAGPVTDPDSLDYHLGVPLEWLRQGGPAVNPHWAHARITGLGEGINLLGLAAGTDGLGAAVQLAGLVIVMAAIGSFGKSPRDRLLGLALALPPVVVPLAITQKPQLFPAAAVVIAMLLARSARSPVDFALVFGCCAFAMACKDLFFVSGGVVLVAALAWAAKHRVFRTAALCAVALFALLLVPVLARNYYLYGDPVSPFLEAFRAHPDAEVTGFADCLRDSGEAHTAEGLRHFLADLVIPPSLGDIQTILGIGIFAVLLISWTGASVATLVGSAIVLLFTITGGQLAPRHLLEPYLWCAAAAVLSPWSRAKSILVHALVIQTLGVSALALFTAALLFPGALTPELRDRTMRRYTYGYREALWMDRVLPPEATVITDSRAHALCPRQLVIPSFNCYSASAPALLTGVNKAAPNLFLVTDYPLDGSPGPDCVLKTVAGPERFNYAVRNPFNGGNYEAVASRLVCK